MSDGAIVFVAPGSTFGLQGVADADFVIGVYPNGSGRVLKNRHGQENEMLTPECVEWLRANPTNRPEDFDGR